YSMVFLPLSSVTWVRPRGLPKFTSDQNLFCGHSPATWPLSGGIVSVGRHDARCLATMPYGLASPVCGQFLEKSGHVDHACSVFAQLASGTHGPSKNPAPDQVLPEGLRQLERTRRVQPETPR